jgi:hypothetical protein
VAPRLSAVFNTGPPSLYLEYKEQKNIYKRGSSFSYLKRRSEKGGYIHVFGARFFTIFETRIIARGR